MPAIDVDGVTKDYGGGVTAVRDLSITVEEGEIYGFLGPNGAGKSTTINILLDFVRPTAGTARVLGYHAQENSEQVRQRTGVLPEGYQVYERLPGRKHLEFVMNSKDIDRDDGYVDEVLERVGLDGGDGDRPAGGYSKGMRQRLVLGMALVGDPDLLILDEPTSGLDPNGARELREIVKEENERGTTVFFSSHILGQVEQVCDRVGVLHDGRIVAEGTVGELRDRLGAESTLEVTVSGDTDVVADRVRSVGGVSSVLADGATVSIGLQNSAKMDALDAVRDAGATIRNFETRKESLEDLFAELTEEEEAATETPTAEREAGEVEA